MCGHSSLLLTLGLLTLLSGLPRLLRQHNRGKADCSGSAPCSLAFLSDNPLSLRCPAASETVEGTVYWQYLDLRQPHAEPRTFAGPQGLRVNRGPLRKLGSRSTLRGGSLILSQAQTSESGLYICRSGSSTLAAYQVDVQDSSLLHVSHRGLGQSTLGNQSLRLSPGSVPGSGCIIWLHTRWGPWQDCDRCGAVGERKRVGFCYATLGGDAEKEEGEEEGDTLPCGLMEYHLGQALPQRSAELQFETCRRACGREAENTGTVEVAGARNWWQWSRETALDWLEPRSLLMESVHLHVHEDARLTCPGASVYTPASWQRGSTPITRLELLRAQSSKGNHWLDNETGGGVYHINRVQPSDRGVYRCWVRGREVATFHLELHKPLPNLRRITRLLVCGPKVLVTSCALVFVILSLAEMLRSIWCE